MSDEQLGNLGEVRDVGSRSRRLQVKKSRHGEEDSY